VRVFMLLYQIISSLLHHASLFRGDFRWVSAIRVHEPKSHIVTLQNTTFSVFQLPRKIQHIVFSCPNKIRVEVIIYYEGYLSGFWEKISLTLSQGDFDLPNEKCLNRLLWFFFDKVRNFLSNYLNFLMDRNVFLKNVVL
jgi:hypothetical protein